MAMQSFTDYARLPANQGGLLGLKPGAKADLVTVTTPNGAKFTVHRKVAGQFQRFLGDLSGQGYNIDPKQSGGYNDRTIAGTGTKSQHAYGNAIDLNWQTNPQGSASHNLPANVGETAAKYGLKWGGTFSNPDPMHFEVAQLMPDMGYDGAPAPASNGEPMLQPRPSQVSAIGGTSMGAPTGGPMPTIAPAPDANKSALVKALLQASMQRAPQSRNWMEAIGNALPMWAAAYQDSKLGDERKAHSSSLAKALLEAKEPDALVRTLLGSGDPDLQTSAIQMKVAQMKAAEEAKKPQVGRYKVENGVVVDSVTGQIVAGQLGNGEKPPSGYRAAEGGKLEFIPGGPADPATNNRQVKYNEGQTKAANFGKMMTEAEKLVGDQANPLGFWGQLRENMTPEVLSNQMRSPEYQKYRQAADQWIRAKLRKESGATITPQESEGEFRTFFPQPGDGPEVVAQKKLARQQAIQGMQAESGGAYEQLFPGGQQTTPPPATGTQQPSAPPAPTDFKAVPRPQGTTDEQIVQEAFRAIKSGKDEQAVRQQLEAWGIRF